MKSYGFYLFVLSSQLFHLFSPYVHWVFLYPMFWNVDCLPPSHLVHFLEFCPVFSFRTCFFVSFYLPHCVHFYVLGRCAMPPSLGRVDLCRCPVIQSALSPEPGCSKGVAYVGFMCPSVVVEPWLLLAHQWVGMTLRLTGYEDGLLLQLIILCRGWSYGVGFTRVGLWFLLSPPFCVLFMELIGDLVWTEASHWVWSFCDLFRGTLVQAQVSYCLCWARWYLGEAMLQTQVGCH